MGDAKVIVASGEDVTMNQFGLVDAKSLRVKQYREQGHRRELPVCQ